ncbi:MAG: UDP-N-acetylmuramoyl-L-alanine--D-glutamate ligase [Phycisphaerales bacterium]|nr:UDP-N-acetylmuramoyl-L-alanine--D-glutamate ligase [Phycisphaerales bacterium]
MKTNHQSIPASTVGSVAGVRVLVVGLGRFGGGVGVTRWLAEQGARVTVTDLADAASLAESLDAIAGLPVSLQIGGHDRCDLSTTDLAVINPAVHKSTSGLFAEILRRNIPWTTEMNLFCERCPAPVVGVTGSYGKSTTCAMLAEVLESNLRSRPALYTGVHLGGNIGRSLLNDLPTIRPTDVVVLEMSNAQLEDLPRISWAPAIAVITNIQPQHLDRHGSFEAYIGAKLNLVRPGGPAGPVIVGDLHSDAERLLTSVLRENRQRLVRVKSPAPPIELTLPGRHNQANAACVWTVCRAMSIDDAAIRAALREFRGLPHRLEHVRTVDGVRYINDSKSTAPAATMIAIEALLESEPRASVRAELPPPEPRASARAAPSVGVITPKPLILIVGGQRKDVPLAECAGSMARACRVVICYGQAGPAFAAAVRQTVGASPDSATTVHEVDDVPAAVHRARIEARSGDAVLFSPGAPSFDQYVNFTERGRHFVELVNTM